MRVLLAVDGSDCSEAAAEEIARRFRPEEDEIRVLHAVEWTKELPLCMHFAEGPNAGRDVVRSRDESFERARQLVNAIAASLQRKGFHTRVSCPDADPRHAIVDSAKSWPADLIVMGSHGRRGLDRLLLGSVADWVVRHAPCSVEVIRAKLAA
jgi:nucleotide-binding universal stress UspA family protein